MNAMFTAAVHREDNIYADEAVSNLKEATELYSF